MADHEPADDVTVSMELTGEYEAVLSKLRADEPGRRAVSPLVEDVEVLLETVVRLDGGTRSAIAAAMPAETTVTYDAEAVVETLRVLERYDLVALEGNTWTPGEGLDL